MRDKHVFWLYISSSSLKKRLTHAYGLTLMSLFIKIMMRNYETDFTFWMLIICLSLLPKLK